MTRHLIHDWFIEPLPQNVIVGDGSWLYSTYAFRHYVSRAPIGVQIGRHSGLYNGTFFDLGPEGTLRIGDYCTIVGAIFSTNGEVDVGDYVLVAHDVVIIDVEVATPSDLTTNRRSKRIRIGSNVWIGARAIILGGADIGQDAVVGAGAVIRGTVAAGMIVAGNPARVVGSVYQPTTAIRQNAGMR